MLDYENATSDADIRFERVGDALTIKVPKEGFVRGAGSQLRSRDFWLLVGLMCLLMRWPDVLTWARRLFQGHLGLSAIMPRSITHMLVFPVSLICVYLALFSQSRVTIRLYRRSLVRSTHGLFGSSRETEFDRHEIAGVHDGGINLSLKLSRPLLFIIPRRTVLFHGRTREERERVAAAIRNWIEPAHADVGY